MIQLGDAGVLAPGKWRWARALAWLAALMVLLALPAMVPNLLGRAFGLSDPSRNVIGALALLATYLLYVAAVRFGERRAVTELALRPAAGELLTGLVIGAAMFTAVFGVLRVMGVYTLAPGTWGDWLHDVWQMTSVGFIEELVARLVIFRLLMRAFGLWPALIGSALLFGAAHLANPNASLVAAFAIAVEAGLMLAAFYLVTDRIWMSIGAHIAWNFVQGPVFGASVSGHVEHGSLFVSAPVAGASTWLSGGPFGPEASLPALLVGLAIFVLLMRVYRQRRERVDSAAGLA